MRLCLFSACLLSSTVADILWGCEPSCSPPVNGTRPRIVSQLEINATSISIGNLTKILTAAEGNYGLLILESGSDFKTQWLLSSPSQSVGISGLASSKTAASNFAQLADSVYSIDPSLYVNSPKGIVIVSPHVILSYRLESTGKTDCELDGLLFTVIPWDEAVTSHISQDITFLIPQQCSYCPTLLLSDKFIRICPKGEERETLPTRSPTEDTTVVTVTSAETITPSATTAEASTPTTAPPTTPSTTISSTTAKTSSTTSSTSLATTSADNKKYRAVFRDDLKGIHLLYLDTTPPLGVISCGELFQDATSLGEGPICKGDGKEVDVFFGSGAVLLPGDVTILEEEEITVEGPHSAISPYFFVDYKKIAMSCENTVTFTIRQVAGAGERNATYQWKLISGPPVGALLQQAANTREVSIPTNLMDKSLTIKATVCNFVNKCTTSGNLVVTMADKTETLLLEIQGIPEIVYPSMAVKIEAVPTFASCDGVIPAREALYNWTVNGTDVFESLPSYRIPAFQYSVNTTLPIKLTTSYKDPVTGKIFTAEASAKITYSAESLIMTIDAARRTHPADVPLLIDASTSRDPNNPSVALKYSWTCQNMTTNQSCHLPAGLNYHSAVFELPGGVLEKGGEFLFTNHFVSPLGQNGTVSSVVKVSSPLLPSVTVVPLVYPKQSVREYIRLLALVSSDEAPMNVSWQVVESSGYGFFHLTDFISGNHINFNIPSNGRKMLASLTIPPKEVPHWQGLSPDTRYLLRITATNPRGSTSADVELHTEEELPQGIVEVTPSVNLTALSTEITFRLGDGWTNLDYPISYRFGYRILQTKNESTIEWLPHASVSSVEVILPSGGQSSPSCLKRTGFTGLIEACDRSGACRLAESVPFYVSGPRNLTLAMSDVVLKISDDFVNGKHLDSIQKIVAMEMEMCSNQVDSSVVDRTAQALLDSLTIQSDLSEWKEVMAATLRLLPSVSDNVLVAMLPVIQKYQQNMGIQNTKNRLKREVTDSMASLTELANITANLTASTTNETQDPEADAAMMLPMYSLLLFRNQPVAEVLLLNINKYLSKFCGTDGKLDAQSTQIITINGGDYTVIQAQAVDPKQPDFLNKTFTTAGDDSSLHFLEVFPSIFTEWNCGNSFYCVHVCLATARINSAVFHVNSDMEERFFPGKAPVNVNHSVSSLHKISIVDPTTGSTAMSYMGLAPLYSVQIPITDYQPTNYYACYMYADSSQAWDATSCSASTFATKVQGTNYITCTCSTSGFIGVFTQSPPPPPSIWLHNEVRITFLLNTTAVPSEPQMKQFKDNLAISGQSNRLVDWQAEKNNESQVIVNVTLRPPFKTTQVTSSYALQSVLRIADPQSGFVAYDGVKIILSSYEMIERELVGDGNARKIIVRMLDKLYPQVVGNKSDSLTTTWTALMADALRISSYRFKNAGLFVGIFFNVTITKPFEEEKYPLSAEEIALMLVESTKYKEIQVVSASGESINLPEILFPRDVVELRVVQQQNPLVTILIIVVSSGVLLTSLYIGGAIVVKIRTDRCLEEERRRMVTVDPADLNAPPRYGEAVQGSGVIRSRHR